MGELEKLTASVLRTIAESLAETDDAEERAALLDMIISVAAAFELPTETDRLTELLALSDELDGDDEDENEDDEGGTDPAITTR